MCIIVYKSTGATFPTKDTLKTCFTNNSDGAGFMLATGSEVLIKKGFMTFKAFWSALNKTRKKYGDALPYVLHFRITTQAGVRADCTHPYPLSDKMDELRKLETSCSVGVAHNGIISLTSTSYSYSYSSGASKITYNDTMLFITDYLSLIIDSLDWYKDSKKKLLIERLSESRLAILDKDCHCELIGSGWVNEGGVWYSNSTYKPYTASRVSSYYGGSVKKYHWEDDYGWEETGSPFDDFSDWDSFWDEGAGYYDFEEYFCPLSECDESAYCSFCKNRGRCKLYDEHERELDSKERRGGL